MRLSDIAFFEFCSLDLAAVLDAGLETGTRFSRVRTKLPGSSADCGTDTVDLSVTAGPEICALSRELVWNDHVLIR